MIGIALLMAVLLALGGISRELGQLELAAQYRMGGRASFTGPAVAAQVMPEINWSQHNKAVSSGLQAVGLVRNLPAA